MSRRHQPGLEPDVWCAHARFAFLNMPRMLLAELSNVFSVFLPQLLLYPNPTDPLNGAAAALLMRDKKAYENKVRGALLGYLFHSVHWGVCGRLCQEVRLARHQAGSGGRGRCEPARLGCSWTRLCDRTMRSLRASCAKRRRRRRTSRVPSRLRMPPSTRPLALGRRHPLVI